MGDRLVVATRGSRLARTQASLIASFVRRLHPEIEVELRTVKTAGDRDARPFAAIGSKGIFTTEVEREVLEGRADIAVHSAKDLTADLPDECAIVCVPPRAHAFDVVVGGEGDGDAASRLGALPAGAAVGTSSMRRRALLGEACPDLEVVEFRGNLDTRLDKVRRGEVAAALLAAAGIERLGGAADVRPAPLDPEWWVPAPGQGALAVEARADRTDIVELFAPLDDADTHTALECERAFSTRLEGGCSVPLGCFARDDAGRLVATGYVGRPDGTHALRDRISGPAADASSLGRELAEALLAGGADDILADARADAVEPGAP